MSLQIPDPPWMHDMEEPLKSWERQRFMLRVYALYATREGTLDLFSQACGYGGTLIRQYATFSRFILISPDAAVQIERLLGRNIAPRERLRPDIFDLPVQE